MQRIDHIVGEWRLRLERRRNAEGEFVVKIRPLSRPSWADADYYTPHWEDAVGTIEEARQRLAALVPA